MAQAGISIFLGQGLRVSFCAYPQKFSSEPGLIFARTFKTDKQQNLNQQVDTGYGRGRHSRRQDQPNQLHPGLAKESLPW